MPYRQDYHIRGAERVDVGILLSTTYAGLTTGTVTPINGLFRVTSSKKDLDVDVGVQTADQIELEMDPRAIETYDDLDCYNLVIDAQRSEDDPSAKLYIGVVINQVGSTPAADDFDFRGVIDAKMSGQGSDWQGEEYDTSPSPTVIWKIAATSLEASDVLEQKLTDLVKDIVDTDPAWIAAQVTDRLGWFLESDPEIREGRYASICNMMTVLQRLLSDAVTRAGSELTITLDDTALGLGAYSAGFETFWDTITVHDPFAPIGQPSWTHKTVHFRYGNPAAFYPEFEGGTLWEPPDSHETTPHRWPYQVRSEAIYTDLLLSQIDISWRLLTPRDEAQDVSWIPQDTIGTLLYAIAWTLGGWVKWEYTTNTSVHCKILTRSDVASNPHVYLADATSDEVDVQPNDSTSGTVQPAAAKYARDGKWSSYGYDGTWWPSIDWSKGGPLLPLTIAPTVCALHADSMDAGIEVHADNHYHVAPMPHNGIFYNEDGPERPGSPGADLSDVHTAMYITFTAPDPDACYGCAGETVTRPIGALGYQWVDGGGATRIGVAFDILSYLNALGRIDQSAYESERTIRVPYITRFKSSTDPGAPEDWRNLQTGYLLELDGVEYIVAGFDRDLDKGETLIRLHANERATFAVADPVITPDEAPATSLGDLLGRSGRYADRLQMAAGSAIEKYAAVCSTPDGLLFQAGSDGWSYGRVIGIAANAGAVGQPVQVIRNGEVLSLDDEYGFTPGQQVYLRTTGGSDSLVANLSATPVRYATDTETLHQVLGVARTPTSIEVRLADPVFLTEEATVPDFYDPSEFV